MDTEKRLEQAIEIMRQTVCPSCHEYKGMVECEADDCGDTYCVFCDPDNHADHPYYPIGD